MIEILGKKNRWLYFDYAILIGISGVMLYFGIDSYFYEGNYLFLSGVLIILGGLLLICSIVCLIKFSFLPKIILSYDNNNLVIVTMWRKKCIKIGDLRKVYVRYPILRYGIDYAPLSSILRDHSQLILILKSGGKIKLKLKNCEEVEKKIQYLLKN